LVPGSSEAGVGDDAGIVDAHELGGAGGKDRQGEAEGGEERGAPAGGEVRQELHGAEPILLRIAGKHPTIVQEAVGA
jgi:hypothetical protein